MAPARCWCRSWPRHWPRAAWGSPTRTPTPLTASISRAATLTGILGGWIADRLIGAQRAVVAGGVFIMVGNAMLTAGNPKIFFVGLLVTMLGVGLLKPNVSNIVAKLYPEGGARRDAGFSIFYMGINIGSAGGSLLVPWCAYHFGWHAGFGLPAAGMVFGLLQFLATRRFLKGHGAEVVTGENRGSWTPVIIIAAVIAVVTALALNGSIEVDPSRVGGAFTWVFSVLALGYFAYLYWFAGLDGDERKRVLVMLALFIGSVMFWAGFEQMGASFNLFAYRYTDLNVFGINVPPGMLQGANPAVHHHFRSNAGRRVVETESAQSRFLGSRQVRVGHAADGLRLPDHVFRLLARHDRNKSAAHLAHCDVPVSQPG